MPPLDPALPDDPPDLATLDPASAEYVSGILAHGLRFDARGKPTRKAAGWDFAAGIAAERLTEHLLRSGIVFMKRRPSPPHTAG